MRAELRNRKPTFPIRARVFYFDIQQHIFFFFSRAYIVYMRKCVPQFRACQFFPKFGAFLCRNMCSATVPHVPRLFARKLKRDALNT